MIEIRRLTLEEIRLNQVHIMQWFQRHINKYPPAVDSAEEWYERSLNGTFQLWGFIDLELIGVFLTAVDGNSLNAFSIIGRNILKYIKYVPDILAEFAKENQVRYVQTLSTPALARIAYRQFDQRQLVLISLDTWGKISSKP